MISLYNMLLKLIGLKSVTRLELWILGISVMNVWLRFGGIILELNITSTATETSSPIFA